MKRGQKIENARRDYTPHSHSTRCISLACFELMTHTVTALYQNHMTLSSSVQTASQGYFFFSEPNFYLVPQTKRPRHKNDQSLFLCSVNKSNFQSRIISQNNSQAVLQKQGCIHKCLNRPSSKRKGEAGIAPLLIILSRRGGACHARLPLNYSKIAQWVFPTTENADALVGFLCYEYRKYVSNNMLIPKHITCYVSIFNLYKMSIYYPHTGTLSYLVVHILTALKLLSCITIGFIVNIF